MRICLIRHGETDWTKARRLQGREDIPLNVEGLAQADAVAEYLRATDWDCILSSPLSRAVQTAEVIARKLYLPDVIKDACFMERDYGKASGLTPKERKLRFPDRQYENMEDWEALRDRVYGGLTRYIRACRGKNMIIVSHGAAINALLSTLSGGEIGTGKTRLATACLNMLRYHEDALTIEYVNRSADQAHSN